MKNTLKIIIFELYSYTNKNMQFLFWLDVAILDFFNKIIANPFFDTIMPVITKVKYWIPLYCVSIVLLFWKGKRKGRILAVLLLLGVLISDSFSSRLVKNLVDRPRPFKTLTTVRLVGVKPGGSSFPSSHALNNFCAATIIALFYRRRAWIFYSLAGLMAFTRLYLGVHYPSDVAVGIILGCLLGYLIVIGAQAVVKRFYHFDILEQKE